MFLDNITNKFYPFIFVLIVDKESNAYKDIFNFIYGYINNDHFDDTSIKLLSFSTDFEEAMIITFKEIFG